MEEDFMRGDGSSVGEGVLRDEPGRLPVSTERAFGLTGATGNTWLGIFLVLLNGLMGLLAPKDLRARDRVSADVGVRRIMALFDSTGVV